VIAPTPDVVPGGDEIPEPEAVRAARATDPKAVAVNSPVPLAVSGSSDSDPVPVETLTVLPAPAA
jgi:hypothetical protein